MARKVVVIRHDTSHTGLPGMHVAVAVMAPEKWPKWKADTLRQMGTAYSLDGDTVDGFQMTRIDGTLVVTFVCQTLTEVE